MWRSQSQRNGQSMLKNIKYSIGRHIVSLCLVDGVVINANQVQIQAKWNNKQNQLINSLRRFATFCFSLSSGI